MDYEQQTINKSI